MWSGSGPAEDSSPAYFLTEGSHVTESKYFSIFKFQTLVCFVDILHRVVAYFKKLFVTFLCGIKEAKNHSKEV